MKKIISFGALIIYFLAPISGAMNSNDDNKKDPEYITAILNNSFLLGPMTKQDIMFIYLYFLEYKDSIKLNHDSVISLSNGEIRITNGELVLKQKLNFDELFIYAVENNILGALQNIFIDKNLYNLITKKAKLRALDLADGNTKKILLSNKDIYFLFKNKLFEDLLDEIDQRCPLCALL
jgi:hypothetical protein